MGAGNQTVVMIPVYGSSIVFEDCLKSVLTHTPHNVPIFVCDDASPEGPLEDKFEIEKETFPNLNFQRRESNLGFVENCNEFMRSVKDCNVILVNSDVVVSYGWFEAMLNPFHQEVSVGTVTAMTNSGSIATVRVGEESFDDLSRESLDQVNHALQTNALKIHAQLPVAVGHCMLLSAEALELVGLFDTQFSPGYGEEVDFSLRATNLGFKHYLANTLVAHKGSATFGKVSDQLKLKHNELLEKKHPGFHQFIQNPLIQDKQVEVVFLQTLISMRKIRLLIDARAMAIKLTGTSRLIFQTIKSFEQFEKYEISVLVNEQDVQYWRGEFSNRIKIVTYAQIKALGKHFDIAYAPNQISNTLHLQEYEFWGKRVVVLQLDFIAYSSFSYFANVTGFVYFRRAVEESFRRADAIVYISNFISEIASKQFLRFCINDSVVSCGVDHLHKKGTETFIERRLLVVGAGFSHKNHAYILRLHDSLSKTLPGLKTIFVGPKPDYGDDKEFFSKVERQIQPSIEFYDWISDDDLHDQFSKAHLVLYPSNSEGFGFIPYEAANFDRASLFSLNTSLKDHLLGAPAEFTFSFEKDLETIDRLLTDNAFYSSQLKFVKSVGNRLTWENVASRLDKVFENVLNSKPYAGDESLVKWEINQPKELFYVLLKVLGSRSPVLNFFPVSSARRRILVNCIKRLLK